MSNTPQDLFDRVAELTELYLLDEITDEQLAELEALVRDNKQAAQAMRTILKQAGTMRVVFSEQQRFASRVGEVDRNEYLALLQTLGPTQEPEPVHLVGSLDRKRPLWQQWPVIVPSAIAAILALAVTLIVTLSNNESSSPIAHNNQNKPAESAQPILRDQTTTPVATLTAQHNATWGRPASAGPEHPLTTGSKLHPNQRLTLTAGFAEITTNNGAIAIIQAPATIELLDSDNALHLHTGKLVGICETESSKGFLVRTPHIDITDLGTRFGVDATKPESTEAHVLDGEIQVTRRSSEDGFAVSDTLTKGQAVRADSRSTRLTRIPATSPAFVTAMPGRFLPQGTGFGLAFGDTDPNWRVVAIDGQPLTDASEMQVVYSGFGDAASSQWLLVPKDLQPPLDQGDRTITCRVTLQLPASFDPNRSELIMGFMADHKVTGIRVNGSPLDVPENKLDRNAPLNELPIHALTRPGNNTVEVDMFDKDNHTALNVAFELRPLNP